ncbi:hypothetical protein AB9F42_29975 [Rhizobium leguminosarum]|uniref:hypothetical protein n=1 Tax=Rhizobium leguminosarum TaxID=384 RepID=UPI003F9709C5
MIIAAPGFFCYAFYSHGRQNWCSGREKVNMESVVPENSNSPMPRTSALGLADKATLTRIGNALADFKEKEVGLYEAVKDKPKLLKAYRSVINRVDHLLSRRETLPWGRSPDQKFGVDMVAFTSFWTSSCLLLVTGLAYLGLSHYFELFIFTGVRWWYVLFWYLMCHVGAFNICFLFFLNVARAADSLNEVVILQRDDNSCTFIRTNQNDVEGLELEIAAFLESLRLDNDQYQTGCFKCLQDFKRCQASNHRLLCALLLICCCADQILTLRKVLS